MKYKVFWCKVNKYYTDEWLNSEYLWDKSGIFIASCVVTDNAKKKWIKFIKQEIPNLTWMEKLYISWCGAFTNGNENNDFFSIYPELWEYKEKIEILPEKPYTEKKISVWTEKISQLKTKLNLTTKKFLLIQWWCDSFCTFCLTVIKRGRHFYRMKEDIVDEIIEFEMQWWKEIVITWVNLWAWWQDTTNNFKEPKLAELLNYILEKTDIPRIRISSLWPEFINDDLLKVFAHKRIYPHFHLSIQSWSNAILKSMKRHYDKSFLEDTLWKIRNIQREDQVDISIWADLIVWFPGETQEDFNDTYNLVTKYKITKVHAFPFSNHTLWETVPASFFPNQIDEKIKKERLQSLLTIWENVRNDFIESQKWNTFEILIESVKNNIFKWWTENYIECTNSNIEILSWNIEKNSIIIWKLK